MNPWGVGQLVSKVREATLRVSAALRRHFSREINTRMDRRSLFVSHDEDVEASSGQVACLVSRRALSHLDSLCRAAASIGSQAGRQECVRCI